MINDDDDAIELKTVVTSLKKLQPGDVLDVVIRLRKLMSFYETASYTLYANFENVGGPALEEEAAKARRTLELSTARVASLLAEIEKTPYYQELRKRTLEQRKVRRTPKTAQEE